MFIYIRKTLIYKLNGKINQSGSDDKTVDRHLTQMWSTMTSVPCQTIFICCLRTQTVEVDVNSKFYSKKIAVCNV